MAKKPNAADESEEQQSAENAPEEQPMAAEKPADVYVPEDQQFAEYKVSMTEKHRKSVKTIYVPMAGFPGGFPHTFMRPEHESKTLTLSEAGARQLKVEGWSVEKVG